LRKLLAHHQDGERDKWSEIIYPVVGSGLPVGRGLVREARFAPAQVVQLASQGLQPLAGQALSGRKIHHAGLIGRTRPRRTARPEPHSSTAHPSLARMAKYDKKKTKIEFTGAGNRACVRVCSPPNAAYVTFTRLHVH
jgi:hypothetical protein